MKGTKATLSILALLIVEVAAFPASVSAVQGPSLTVTTDTALTVDFTGHIVIAADGVTFDCAGHTVTGDGSGSGILLSGRTGVTVKNCQVTSFDNGFTLVDSSDNTLQRNVAEANLGFGFFLNGSSGNTLEENTANGIMDNRVLLIASSGFFLSDSYGNILTGNTASHNQFDGFLLFVSHGNILTGNTANDNGRSNYFLSKSSGNALTGNTG